MRGKRYMDCDGPRDSLWGANAIAALHPVSSVSESSKRH